MELQFAKQKVSAYLEAFSNADAESIKQVINTHFVDDARIYACYPFDCAATPDALTKQLWQPLMQSFSSLQRRQDVFMAGKNTTGEGVWVMSMGHFAGLFDEPFLAIPNTQKLTFLRYAEFFEVSETGITSHAIFFDLIALMQQAGLTPLPAETGHTFVYPGPQDHNGILLQPQPDAESTKTIKLVEQMVRDLDALNKSGNDTCPASALAQCWSDNMYWYGPAGIGATYTIERYQKQHQTPFRTGLTDKVFNGHIARFSEGQFACFFGWPNLTNRAKGGFLGMPSSDVKADMRVVDVYYRKGDKLVENWVFMDILYWLKQQGVDVLARTTGITSPQS